MKVLITYDTEAGDHGVVGVFERRPTNDEQMAIIAKYIREEIYDGMSYASLNIFDIDTNVKRVPKPTKYSLSIEAL